MEALIDFIRATAWPVAAVVSTFLLCLTATEFAQRIWPKDKP